MNTLPNPFLISPLEPVMAGEMAAAPRLTDPEDAAAEFYGVGPCMRTFESRFVLDAERFFEDIEPPPLFLQPPIEALRILSRFA